MAVNTDGVVFFFFLFCALTMFSVVPSVSAYRKWSQTQTIVLACTNQATNGPIAHLRLFVLSKLMVTVLKIETYWYGSRYSLKKPLISVSYSNLIGVELSFT